MKNSLKNSCLLKRGVINCWILLPFFLNVTADAQPVDDPQDHAARTFMKSLFDKDTTRPGNLWTPTLRRTLQLTIWHR